MTARTTVAQHAGDLATGTLRAIEPDLEVDLDWHPAGFAAARCRRPAK